MNGSVAPSYMSSLPPSPSGVGRGAPFALSGNYDGPSQVSSELGSARSGGQVSASMRSRARPPLMAPYANDDYPPPTPSDAASRSGRSTPEEIPVFRQNGKGPAHKGTKDRDGRSRLLDDCDSTASGARIPPSQQRPNTAHCGSRDMADCLSWPAKRESFRPRIDASRPGKRYGERGAAQEILPWAAQSADPDFNNRSPHQRSRVAPFGTDADMRHRRPEDAGSADYQPANQVDPRNRPF